MCTEQDCVHDTTYIQPCPGDARKAFGVASTPFEDLHGAREVAGLTLYHPFTDKEEWELAETLVTSGMSLKKIDKLLKLPIMCNHMQTSYKYKHTLLEKIDTLPGPGPDFECWKVTVKGDLQDANGVDNVEELKVSHRDPVECVCELHGNVAFREHLCYPPHKDWEDNTCTECMHNKMWMADWWHKLQAKLPPGVTIAPVILASDKTCLSQFSGDKSAWPVYITLENIAKATRHKMSFWVSILLGYIPISKLTCFSKPKCLVMGHRLFHHCMHIILAPLFTAGSDGVDITCADSGIRHDHPILAVYVADFPQQALIACCKESHCPQCTCEPGDRGDPLDTIFADSGGTDLGIWAIAEPFWLGLPHCNIFQCFTPNILHQLHKGVFKDHLCSWCMALSTKPEIDTCFQAMPPHPSHRHFKKGISTISQWSGTEYKNMEKAFVGLISGAIPLETVCAAHALLDFIYLAQYPSHSTTTLQWFQDALNHFHKHKDVFHFHILKIHSMEHYVESIQS
ncbi:hypothetical protein K439DRAFT_1648226 [Ramaria rubella]|nr:hypothetical protein K439DRAFT_1648226 [Ramaria rubella]